MTLNFEIRFTPLRQCSKHYRIELQRLPLLVFCVLSSSYVMTLAATRDHREMYECVCVTNFSTVYTIFKFLVMLLYSNRVEFQHLGRNCR